MEFKINFMKPANTDRLIAVGQVLQAGHVHPLGVPGLGVRRNTYAHACEDDRDDDVGAGNGALAACPGVCGGP